MSISLSPTPISMPKKPKKGDFAVPGAVTVPRILPPLKILFEDTPISMSCGKTEQIYFTLNEPHDTPIDPFNDPNHKVVVYKKPFTLHPGTHNIAALAFSKKNHRAAPSVILRRSFVVVPRSKPELGSHFKPSKTSAKEQHNSGGTLKTHANGVELEHDALSGWKMSGRDPATGHILLFDDALTREYMILVDRSGSNRGLEFERMREALKRIAVKLPENALVNIIGFGTESTAPKWTRSEKVGVVRANIVSYASTMSSDLGASHLKPALECALDNAVATTDAPLRKAGLSTMQKKMADCGFNPTSTTTQKVQKRLLQIIVLSDGEFHDFPQILSCLRKGSQTMMRLVLLNLGPRANRVKLDEVAALSNGTSIYVSASDNLFTKVDSIMKLASGEPNAAIVQASMPRLKSVTMSRAHEQRNTTRKRLAKMYGIDMFDGEPLGRCLLHVLASKRGKNGLKDVNDVLEYAPEQLNQQGHDGKAPLHFACEYNNLPIVKILVEHGADITLTDIKGCPPLFYARQDRHIEVVRFMVNEAGAASNGWPHASTIGCCSSRNSSGEDMKWTTSGQYFRTRTFKSQERQEAADLHTTRPESVKEHFQNQLEETNPITNTQQQQLASDTPPQGHLHHTQRIKPDGIRGHNHHNHLDDLDDQGHAHTHRHRHHDDDDKDTNTLSGSLQNSSLFSNLPKRTGSSLSTRNLKKHVGPMWTPDIPKPKFFPEDHRAIVLVSDGRSKARVGGYSNFGFSSSQLSTRCQQHSIRLEKKSLEMAEVWNELVSMLCCLYALKFEAHNKSVDWWTGSINAWKTYKDCATKRWSIHNSDSHSVNSLLHSLDIYCNTNSITIKPNLHPVDQYEATLADLLSTQRPSQFCETSGQQLSQRLPIPQQAMVSILKAVSRFEGR